jgi:hypothetical protein
MLFKPRPQQQTYSLATDRAQFPTAINHALERHAHRRTTNHKNRNAFLCQGGPSRQQIQKFNFVAEQACPCLVATITL